MKPSKLPFGPGFPPSKINFCWFFLFFVGKSRVWCHIRSEPVMNPWFTHDNPWFNLPYPGFGGGNPRFVGNPGFFQTRDLPVTNPWFTRDNPWKKHGYKAQNYLQIWFDFDGFFVTQLVISTHLAGWKSDPANWKSDLGDRKSDLCDRESDLSDRESKLLIS
jgi:hypothetical protein